GTEYQLVFQDIAEAGKNSLQRERFARPGRTLRSNAQHGKHRNCAGGERRGIDSGRSAEKGVEQSANRRTKDCCKLKNAGIPGHGRWTIPFKGQVGERAPGGKECKNSVPSQKKEKPKRPDPPILNGTAAPPAGPRSERAQKRARNRRSKGSEV